MEHLFVLKLNQSVSIWYVYLHKNIIQLWSSDDGDIQICQPEELFSGGIYPEGKQH